MATDRRIRTKWLVQQRYRRAANIATIGGLAVGIAIVASIWPQDTSGWLDRKFLITSSMVVLLATLGPRLLVKALWRMVRWRNFEEWS